MNLPSTVPPTLPPTMPGAVFHGPRDIRIEEVPVPEPGPGDLLIAVSRNGICGSDLHTYVGAEHGGAAMHVPGIVLGHEFAGTVAAVGDGVDDIVAGTAVAIAPIEWCGTCDPCRHSWPHLCRRLGIYGGYLTPLHGGLAPYVRVSRRSAYAVPDGLDVADAALAEPMAVALHAVRRAPTMLGSTVLVLGSGPIGLGVTMAALAAGAAVVIVSEISSARRAAATQAGATLVLDPTVDDPQDAARSLTRRGVDVVFETTANQRALAQGIRALRARGTLVSVAGWGEPAGFDMGRAMAKEIDVRFTMTYEPAIDFPATLGMLADGRFDARKLVTDHIPLERLVVDGLEELLHHADRHVKILVDPNA